MKMPYRSGISPDTAWKIDLTQILANGCRLDTCSGLFVCEELNSPLMRIGSLRIREYGCEHGNHGSECNKSINHLIPPRI